MFHIRVLARDPRGVVVFDTAMSVPEETAAPGMIGLLLLAIINLADGCDDPRSCIEVHGQGNLVRNIAGENLAELGRRVRASTITTIGQWWSETKGQDLV